MYTLADLPRKGAALHGDRTAVVFEETRLTYAELNRRVNRAAHALSGLGLKPRERVTILSDNSARYLETYLAAAKLALSVTPLNTRLSDSELEHIVGDSEAVAILAGDGYEQRAASLLANMEGLRFGVSLDNDLAGFTGYEAALAQAPDHEPELPDGPRHDELAVLMYTGGTTGLPKGVMLSHRNIMTATIANVITCEFTRADCTCHVLPMFHVAWWPILSLLLVGGTVVINRRPDINQILELIERERCTHMNLVPSIYGLLLDVAAAESHDLSSLRALNYSGSPFAVETLKRAINVFGPIFAQGYGATETAGGAITYFAAEDHHLDGADSRLLVSAGKAAICSEVKVVDERDQAVDPGAVGEVCVRGEHVMSGYWKNPELTERALRGGWYHTGDLGYLDESGFLFLSDRKSDMIITGGENVYPTEVENSIYTHPGVLECSVVGVPDDRWGEAVQAVVVPRDGSQIDAQAIIDHCHKRLAGYKCPKRVAFVESLPKTAVGKISRKEVKKLIR